jgi:hypothetical protein
LEVITPYVHRDNDMMRQYGVFRTITRGYVASNVIICRLLMVVSNGIVFRPMGRVTRLKSKDEPE